jgi:SAM-dependent methyltransferase
MPSSTKSRRPKGSKSPKSKDKKGRKKDRRLNAKNADRYDLYQRSVNSPDTDVEFLRDTYREIRGKDPHHLREDFCGTALLASEWIKQGEGFTAEGFDLDEEPIQWGKRHNFAKLGQDAERMTFHLKDVRSRSDRRPDICTAQNFSYCCFKERAVMKEYFETILSDLDDDGLFVMDLYGGPDAITEMEEVREIGGGVEYVWDQDEYWPATAEYRCMIHFRFHDGSEMHRAFEYEWRLWNMMELKDLLLEVGFKTAHSYFEGTDEDDPEEGNGIFERDDKGENIDAWIAYIVAAK